MDWSMQQVLRGGLHCSVCGCLLVDKFYYFVDMNRGQAITLLEMGGVDKETKIERLIMADEITEKEIEDMVADFKVCHKCAILGGRLLPRPVDWLLLIYSEFHERELKKNKKIRTLGLKVVDCVKGDDNR
jgi:hypothetical protein